MHFPNPVAAFVFDCDGVLLDTVRVKIASFRAWVPEQHADRRDEFNRYNRGAFGQSRRRQIKHFFEGILGQSITKEQLELEIARFAEINLRTVLAAPWLPGSREFVERAHARGVPLYVLSGTPQDELRNLCEHHGVDWMFADIIGSPAKKADALRAIAQRLGAAPGTIWFVGDATHDCESAAAAGTGFIYKPSEAQFTPTGQYPKVNNLLEIYHEAA